MHTCSCISFLNIVSCIILLRGCLTSKLLCISHCSFVGRWRVTEASSNNWYQLPFVSVFVGHSYNHGAENQNFLRKRTGGKIFSVLECTGQFFKEVTPHRPGVTGMQRGEANLGASLLPPVLSALEISVTTGLMAPPEVTAKPVLVTATPCSRTLTSAHPDKQNDETHETSNKITEFPTSTSFQCISSLLLAEKRVAEETQNSCSPLCAVIATSARLWLPQ